MRITTQLDEPVDLVATSLNFDHREAAAKEIGGAWVPGVRIRVIEERKDHYRLVRYFPLSRCPRYPRRDMNRTNLPVGEQHRKTSGLNG